MEKNKQVDFTFAYREEGFDSHIEKSIRGYKEFHEDVIKISRYFIESNTSVYDLGSSTGKTVEAMASSTHTFAHNVNYVMVENAKGFQSALENRKSSLLKSYPESTFELKNQSAETLRFSNASFVTSLFTLQFMPVRIRSSVIKRVYDGLNSGGGFVVSEKVYSHNPKIQEMMTFSYYDFKRLNFSDKDILDKEVTLRNMLKPSTRGELEDMLVGAGFRTLEPIWQNFLFVGYLCIK